MAAIKGGDTKPELTIRKALHAAGFRYRLHARDLPGRPDLVFPRYKAAVFVHGCFWHHHDCHLFKWPSTRAEFWTEKIGRNVSNDERAVQGLLDGGWRVAVIWECALKGKTRLDFAKAMQRLTKWLNSNDDLFVLEGY